MTKKDKFTFPSRLAALPHFQGMHYIEVPKKIVKALGGTFKVRLLCSVNAEAKFQCGLMPLGDGRGYIMFSKKRMKETGLVLGSKLRLELQHDKSKYGMKLCEELREVLRQDTEATRRFNRLSPGKQRNIIHYVGSVKNSDKRIEKALKLMENLKLLPEGKESVPAIFGVRPKIDF